MTTLFTNLHKKKGFNIKIEKEKHMMNVVLEDVKTTIKMCIKKK
jgi:hypothetical protein